MKVSSLKVFLLLVVMTSLVQGQYGTIDSLDLKHEKQVKFSLSALSLPVALIGYGAFGIENDNVKLVNDQINTEMYEHHANETLGIDDFSQYAPALAVYGLNLAGIEGKHDFKDRTIILATSYLIMSSTVLSLKSLTHVQRPDGSTYNSFPSGHTATAFVGAEFLWQEYKDESIWYGISGYLVAAGTGYLRMYNKRHWLTDVSAGAGIGILSVKLAYWLYPTINNWLFKPNQPTKGYYELEESNYQTLVLPFYNGREAGISLVINF